MQSTKPTITKTAFDAVVTAPVRNLLKTGIHNSQFVDPDENDFYGGNTTTRIIFSSLCRGMEAAIKGDGNHMLDFDQRQKNSSKYIEVHNDNLVMHFRNLANSNPLPDYMLEKCKLNEDFRPGKQNYVVIGYRAARGKLRPRFDLIVYNKDGKVAYKEKLMDLKPLWRGIAA